MEQEEEVEEEEVDEQLEEDVHCPFFQIGDWRRLLEAYKDENEEQEEEKGIVC